MSPVRDSFCSTFANTVHTRRILLQTQFQDAPCSGDRNPFSMANTNILLFKYVRGPAVAQLVEALRYKQEGCGFDS